MTGRLSASSPPVSQPLDDDSPARVAAGRVRLDPGSLLFYGILGVGLILLTCLPFPDEGVWLRARALVLETTGIGLAALALVRERWPRHRLACMLRSPPLIATALLVGWLLLSALLTSYPLHGHYELMRHLGGVLLFLGVLLGVPKHGLSRLIMLLALVVTATCVEAFIQAGNSGTGRIFGSFGEPQIFSAFLGLMLPVFACAAAGDYRTGRRMSFVTAAVLCAVGLLAGRNRSAWIGAIVGLFVAGLLVQRYSRRRHRWSWQHGLAAAGLVAGGAATFLLMSNYMSSVAGRAQSLSLLSQDQSWLWRSEQWEAALAMAADRPVLGWGLGSYPMTLMNYATGVREARAVLRDGPSLWENAHNTYAQTAAEMGYPGLILTVLVPMTAVLTALLALPEIRRGLRRYLVFGCAGAIVGQMVMAFGSPAWEYPECSGATWLILGIMLHAAGVGAEGRFIPRGETAAALPTSQVETGEEVTCEPA